VNPCLARRSRILRTCIQIVVGWLAIVGVAGSGYAKQSKLLCVNQGGDNGCFSSVQAAIDSSGRRAVTITIDAGMYVENITLNQGQQITLEGTAPEPSDVTLDANNSGSVITVPAGASLTLQSLTIADGNSIDGGGINSGGNLNLESVLLLDNFSSADGGGIFQTSSGKLWMSFCVIESNTSAEGGGIFLAGSGVIDRSALVFNVATDGGGILLSGSAVALTNTLIFDNSADAGDGGGLSVTNGTVAGFNDSIASNQATNDGAAMAVQGGTVTLDNATILGNQSSGSSGGIFDPADQGGVVLSNSILVNQAPSTPDCNGSIVSNGWNLIGDSSGCAISGDTATDLTGVDPLMDAVVCASTNGLAVPCVQTVAAGSPVVGAGDPAKPNKKGKARRCVTNDALGTRRAAGACDIGAFQLP
jgi:hypothetical protein